MKPFKSYLIRAVLCCLPLSVQAQDIELQAISDFTNLDSGAVPYYLDTAGDLNVLAINAAKEEYREKFARAEHTFTGSDGLYDITIKALGEIDGDCTYRLLINGVLQGEAVNPPVEKDYEVIEHTFQGIVLNSNDVIAVESNALSNGLIPEGDAYAFARGRWRSVTLAEAASGETPADMSADLSLALVIDEAVKQSGAQTELTVGVTNNSTINVATTAVVNITLPNELSFNSSDICVANDAGAKCELPNLAPNEQATFTLITDINASGTFEVSATTSADQADNNSANNMAALTIETISEDPVDNNDEDDNSNGSNNTNNSDDTNTDEDVDNNDSANTPEVTVTDAMTTATIKKSGSFGVPGIVALALFSFYRIRKK